jgi:hypothetical protein
MKELKIQVTNWGSLIGQFGRDGRKESFSFKTRGQR